MIYGNDGTTLSATSIVLFLTNGSDIVLVKVRVGSVWAYEKFFQLPYAYTGANAKVWICSDVHISSTTSRDNFISVISEIDTNVGVDHVFVLGDLTFEGTIQNFAWFVEAMNTSDVPSSNWHEIAGNRDDYPAGNFTNFENSFGAIRDFKVEIGNIVFICWGGLDELPSGNHPPASVTFLEDSIQNNSDKNVIVLAHHPLADVLPATVVDIVNNNRLEGWFNGHTHLEACDDSLVFNPLALYEQVDFVESEEGELVSPYKFLSLSDSQFITEGVDIFHCPSINRSLFGTFKFGSRKFGLNIDINLCLGISEDILIKFNGKWQKDLFDILPLSESVQTKFIAKRSISSSIPISESIHASCNHYAYLTDNMGITENLANNTTAKLNDVIGSFEELLEIDFDEAISFKSDWKFLIKNSAGQTVASLTNARKRWFTQRLNDESEAGFILDADDEKCDASILVLGVSELRIEYKGVLMWAGQLVSARKTAKGNDIYWEVLAKDWTALLGKRFCGVETIREFTTIDAGTIAWTLISEAQALTNGSFGITLGTIEPSIVRSPKYDKKNILEALKEMANAGQDGSASYGFDFEVTPEKVFNVYYPYRGTIRENVVFRYPGNCEDFEALVDSWGIVNQEWGLGQHWTGNTAVVSRADVDSQLLYKRREAIKNYRDMSVLTFLQDTVYQDVQWLKNPSTVMRFSSRVDAKSGILDYEVGDGVAVVCDKFDIDEWLWVYERKIDIGDNDQLKVTLTVGD